MNSIRFITSSELQHVRTLYSIDNRSHRTAIDIDSLVEMLRIKMDVDKTCSIVMMFDPTDLPIAMYVGFEFSRAAGWMIGLTKVLRAEPHFNTTAAIIAPALDLLISTMESKGYYKFWMGAPEIHHNIRNKIMRRHSKMLDRYSWYDEEVIPLGTRSPTPMFAAHTKIHKWHDLVIRMFVLSQQERVRILKQQGNNDYNGTIIE